MEDVMGWKWNVLLWRNADSGLVLVMMGNSERAGFRERCDDGV